MITGIDKIYFDTFLDDFVWQVKHAIETKPINRRTQKQGDFSAVVNNTGRLRDSVRKEYTSDEMRVICLSYIENLVFGLAPGKFDSPVSDIDMWLAQKGLEYNPYNVSQNLFNRGSSIWQYFKGADSGLLAEVDVSQALEDLKEQLAMSNIKEITSNIVNILIAA